MSGRPLRSTTAAALAQEALATDAITGRTHVRDRLCSVAELGNSPPVRPLVDGLLYRDTLAQIAGPPGTYKTFITVGIACSVALGRDWSGHAVPEAGPVIYIAAEGASGMRARVLAWCDYHHVDPAGLADRLLFLPEPLQLGESFDVAQAVDVVEEVRAALVVLDTRARCTLGLEENSATEQGRAIHAAESIQRASGAAVLVVHHSGRGGDHGRGSTAWDGAVWSDLRLTGSDLGAQIHCEKHKEVPAGCDHKYRLVSHVVPQQRMPGADEQQRSTLVAVQAQHLDDEVADRRSTRVVLDVIRNKGGAEGLTRPQIIALAQEEGVSRASAYEAVKVLVDRDRIYNKGSQKRAVYAVA